jgi:hypothetical protein
MQTLAVGDGEAALERLREEAQPFELVVLDVQPVELHKWRTKQAKRVSFNLLVSTILISSTRRKFYVEACARRWNF